MNTTYHAAKHVAGSAQAHEDPIARPSSAPINPVQENKYAIKDVWKENFEEEMVKMMRVVDKFPYVSLDTEYPGVVFSNYEKKFSYHSVRCNVEQLKLIQIGLSFSDEIGNVPEGTTTWQFNLSFDLSKDKHALDAIKLLSDAGIDFEAHASHGIDSHTFAELFTVSSNVSFKIRLIFVDIPFNEEVRWITFHPAFDFAYLMKLLSGTNLPQAEHEFDKELSVYFPTFYDVKYITKCFEKHGTLNRIASNFEV
eukprot:TRINITY_DN7505_c0_g1_i3.p1 TRINITY_DN7505_c0_g1~~TRINITY_DN7505_c0_g1_i3.p1  ORF type:complete len:253 (-),score=49.62 TRINITY_DN7505_c0_g1_i3:532-1290(-)